MTDTDLKSENAALRKQNKDLKALLEEALEIIRKLKELVDQPAQPDTKPKRKSVKRKASVAAKRGGRRQV